MLEGWNGITRRYGLSDEAGVSLALSDVRSVEEHTRRNRSNRSDPGADRLRPGSPAGRASYQALQQWQLFRSASHSGGRLPGYCGSREIEKAATVVKLDM